MIKFRSIIAMTLCFVIAICCASCGSDKPENTNVSQKAYNTAFVEKTTAEPNTFTQATTTTGEIVDNTPVDRTGPRPFFKQDYMMRSITTKQLLSQLGSGVTLGNSLCANGLGTGKTNREYEEFYGNPAITKELINSYKKQGFCAVRLPVSWTDHMDENGNVDSLWLDRVEEIVNYCLDFDLYCIINSQNDNTWLTTSDVGFSKTKQKFSAMWKSIANRFKDYNDYVLFEGVSEPLKANNDKSAPSEKDIKNANALNQAFVNAVRSTGGNNSKRHLVVSTYGSFVDSASLSGFKLPKDSVKNRICAKVNVYIPSAFCFDENTALNWGKQGEKQYLTTVLQVINQRFSALKIPVIIGEFGAIDKGNESARTAYSAHLVSTAYDYYMVCFWNDNGSNMRLIDRATCEPVFSRLTQSIVNNAN